MYSSMAQLVERQAVNLQVAGSSPAGGDHILQGLVLVFVGGHNDPSTWVDMVNTSPS